MSADLLFRGGPVWTGESGGPPPRALATRGGRILAVGSEADVGNLAGPGTRVVELAGRLLLPGFIDAHTHFLTGGIKLSSVRLREVDSRARLASALGDFAATLPVGRWITGGDWDHERWGGELPRSDWIDAATPHHPVFVTRLDLHMGLANRVALRAAGITAETPDPPGGAIERDAATGAPTGILRDKAMELVGRLIPDATADELDAALAAASRHALSLGITQVHDMGPIPPGPWWHLETYRRAHAERRLPLRVYAMVAIETRARLAELVANQGRGDDRLWWGGVKGFVDGSLGSATAWFHEPYADVGGHGLTVTDPECLSEWIHEADALGLHVVVHAIGDRANDWLLDTYRSAAARNGPRDRRFRIEHAQHLTPSAIPRFAEQGVIASVQPCHLVDDGPWAGRRLGEARLRTTYAFRSLLDTGAKVALGTDWTVAPLDPLPNLAAAVTRRTRGGAHPQGWLPDQKLTLAEALAAYTRGAAYAGFSDASTGALRPGAYADLALLSGDPLATPAEETASLHVSCTYVEGEEVFRRD